MGTIELLILAVKTVTVKNLKIGTAEKFAVINLKVEQFGFMTE